MSALLSAYEQGYAAGQEGSRAAYYFVNGFCLGIVVSFMIALCVLIAVF